MNAILALCSFCEVDGPTVLLCTQTYHTRPDKRDSVGTNTNTDTDTNRDDIDTDNFTGTKSTTSTDSKTKNAACDSIAEDGSDSSLSPNGAVQSDKQESPSARIDSSTRAGRRRSSENEDDSNTNTQSRKRDNTEGRTEAQNCSVDLVDSGVMQETSGGVENAGSRNGNAIEGPGGTLLGVKSNVRLSQSDTGERPTLNGIYEDQQSDERNIRDSAIADVFGHPYSGDNLRSSIKQRAYTHTQSSGPNSQPHLGLEGVKNASASKYFNPYGGDNERESLRDLDERSVFMSPFGRQLSETSTQARNNSVGSYKQYNSGNDSDGSSTHSSRSSFANRHNSAHLDQSPSPPCFGNRSSRRKLSDVDSGVEPDDDTEVPEDERNVEDTTAVTTYARGNQNPDNSYINRPAGAQSTSRVDAGLYAGGPGTLKPRPTPVGMTTGQATRLTNPVTGDGTRVMLPIFQSSEDVVESATAEVSEEFRTYERIQNTNSDSRARADSRIQRCNACNLLRPNCPGYFSKDSGTGVEYVSTPAPLSSKLFTIVRKVCVRSLSIEMLPGREGPAVFGDTQNGYVLQYQFTLKDPMARGFRRIYSIVFLMTDLSYLMNSFQFLTAQFRLLVNHLKLQADLSASRPLSSADTQQRLRSASHQTQLPSRSRQRPTPASLKSLDDLTNTINIASRLHQTFSWILNSCATRLVELPTGGPRQVTTGMWNVNKKDNHFNVASKVVLSKAYHQVVEAFISSCPFIIGPNHSDRSSDSETGAHTDSDSGSASDSCQIHTQTTSHTSYRSHPSARGSKNSLDGSLGERVSMGSVASVGLSRDLHRAKHSIDDSIDGSQPMLSARGSMDSTAGTGHSHVLRKSSEVSEDSDTQPLMAEAIPILLTAAQVGQALSRQALRVILYQMLIGNQLIVRGECEEIVISVLFSLAYLLPRDCCTMVPYSHIYRERWECNFLGLSADAAIPTTLDYSSHVIVDVKYNPKPIHKKKPCSHGNPPNSAPSGERSTPLTCADITLRVVKPGKQRTTFNRTQSDIELIGADGFFHVPNGARARSMVSTMRTQRTSIPYPLPEAADTCLLANEILRVLMDNSYSEAVKHQYLISLKEEWFNKAKVFLRFAKTHPKATDVQTLSALLKALRCGTSDLPVLRFWVEALSRADRDIILNKAGPCKGDPRRL